MGAAAGALGGLGRRRLLSGTQGSGVDDELSTEDELSYIVPQRITPTQSLFGLPSIPGLGGGGGKCPPCPAAAPGDRYSYGLYSYDLWLWPAVPSGSFRWPI